MIKKLTRQNLDGIWHALITPWTDDDQLDERRYAREIRSFAGTGLHGLYTGGTTGEFYAQDDDTFERVTKITCDEAHAIGLPVQIGATALATRIAVRRIKVAVKAGADAIQIALPFWLQMRDDETLTFFKDVADAAEGLPIVYYATGRSKRKVEPKLLGEICRAVPALIGAKDTGCDLDTLRAVLKEAPDFSVFGGDHDLDERLAAGGRGGYCAVTGLNARLMVAIYDHLKAGRHDEAARLLSPVKRLMTEVIIPMVTRDGYMDSALDRLMRTLGGGDVGLRCQKPYMHCTPAHLDTLRAWVQRNAPILLEYGR